MICTTATSIRVIVTLFEDHRRIVSSDCSVETKTVSHLDIKTLSAIIGHTSSATTINVYTHVTDTMQRSAADKIEQGLGNNEGSLGETETPASAPKPSPPVKFTPKELKIRRSGTGCITQINDHLFEGRYSPTNAYGKRTPKNVYAKTREECEEKLAAMIAQMKAEIAAEKKRLKEEKKK